ncbi:hypothetical protein SAMN05421882_10245 [Nitrosomonas communis]|uniref:Uncharacterized protein n=1 Tax=Nitrosomonas communis TaxID=44574 RepID=A0A1H2VTS8_9PROT|nr:hypothetical protein SAMN05421882_10245 [Nitrosomonas communis]
MTLSLQFCIGIALCVDELEVLFELLHKADFRQFVNARPWLNSHRLIHGSIFNEL